MERAGVEAMSDGGLRVLRSHLKKARWRLCKARERMEMHDVGEGLDNGDVNWHTGAAIGQVSMALENVQEEMAHRGIRDPEVRD